jgi:hypothetical protein
MTEDFDGAGRMVSACSEWSALSTRLRLSPDDEEISDA